jgi:hypothetical protein
METYIRLSSERLQRRWKTGKGLISAFPPIIKELGMYSPAQWWAKYRQNDLPIMIRSSDDVG